MHKNCFEKWNDKEFPENIQSKIDNFADCGKTNAEKIFRAGFYVGLNNKKIREELGIEE